MSGAYDELEQIFHQPRRLELMAELCGAEDGRSFNALKESCSLSDGNLSRHLQALEKAGAVKIKKSFAGSKPLTTVIATAKGREKFVAYLEALEGALKEAERRAGLVTERKVSLPHGVKVTR